jgi:hypothetical protein
MWLIDAWNDLKQCMQSLSQCMQSLRCYKDKEGTL